MEDEKQFYTIILRHDTSSNWMANNPILALGEYGVEDDTHRVKRGDGESTWESLSYETFGLEFIVTYANLTGNIEDNAELTEALNDKVSMSVFGEGNTKIVTGISILSDVGVIGKITKVSTDLSTGAVTSDSILIQSTDNSLTGAWSIDATGVRILDLHSVNRITDFQTEHRYIQNEFCIFNRRIYKCKATFTSTDMFNEDNWDLITSIYATDIVYNPAGNELASETVQGAIDEVVQILKQKVSKTSLPNKVYGTNHLGDQQFINRDALRKVDTVNGIEANEATKNVQIDASDINYDDNVTPKQTIKQVLDSKVDKNILGENGTVVTNMTVGYSEEQGGVTITTENKSLSTGEVTEKTQSFDVVSQTELDKAVQELTAQTQENLTNATNVINERIDTEVETLNDTINNNKQDIETKLTNGLNTKIDKDIADSLVSGITVSQVEENEVMEPTLKITSKNTDTKTEIVQNVHFKAVGDIQTKMENDHIIVDSTNIDKKVQANIDHLTQVDTRLTNNETEIASLQQHDVNHESVLATHTQQIANHETRIAANETHLTNVDEEIEDIKAQHQTDINEIHTTNADQEAHLTRIDQTNLDQDERIQDNANSIIETNKNVSKNAQNITNLENKAVVYNKERNIDVENNIALKNNMMLTGATPTQYYNLASMKTYNLGLENELTQTEFGTSKVHMNLNSLDRPTIELPSSEKHEISYKDELDTAKTEINANIEDLNNTINETINTKLTELDTKKLDKAFTNNLVNTLTYTGPQSSELFKLNKQDINPNDNSTSNSTFTIKSSDNTLVATPIMDGETLTGIDLATNLDIDVHYFVTSETLNTTIPSDNTIQISSLTDTTSDNVEVKDIVSDSEGTWARVQEVDTEAGTLKCVTFAKHAQAVWGTIKGTITDQQDLKEQLDAKVNLANNEHKTFVVDPKFNTSSSSGKNQYTITYSSHHLNGGSGAGGFGFNSPDDSITYSSQVISSQHGVGLIVNSENVVFNPLESGLTSNKLSPAVRELKGLIDDSNTEITKLQQNKVDKAMQELVQGIEASTFNRETGELTFNYDAFDVTTNGTTKKSIVISDMFKQEDLDVKLSKTDFTQGILLDGISRRIISDYDLSLTTRKLDTTTMTTEEIPYIRLKSVNQTIKITHDNEGTFEQMVLDVDTDNIKVNTPNEGTENQKDIITAVQDLYKLPRITSYQDLAGFEMKPGMITYNIDSVNNLAYLVICKTAYKVAADNLDEDFNTNITNGNLVRIGIPNETT